jgi:hypothetical protein
METFTEDRQVISPALWRVWEQKSRLRGRAHGRKVTVAASAALLVLWLAGMIAHYKLGGFIHILLFVAVAVLVIPLLWDRRSIL